MTLRLRKTLLTSTAFLMTTGVANADLSASADPFAGETALTAAELSEARGGFSMGGFNFNFGVTLSPIFGGDGVFGGNDPIPEEGLFGHDGLFGDDGLFGEEGVFGDSGGPGNGSSSTSTNLTDVSFSTETTTTTTTTSQPAPSQPAPSQGASSGGASGSPTPPTPTSPSTDLAAGGASAPAPTGGVETGSQGSASSQAGGGTTTIDMSAPDAPTSAQAAGGTPTPQSKLTYNGHTGPLSMDESGGVGADKKADTNVDYVPTGTNLVPDPSSLQDPKAMAQDYAGMNISEVIKHQLTYVYNNTKDGAVIEQEIEYNINISNYQQNIDRLGIASSVNRAIPDRSLFNSLF